MNSLNCCVCQNIHPNCSLSCHPVAIAALDQSAGFPPLGSCALWTSFAAVELVACAHVDSSAQNQIGLDSNSPRADAVMVVALPPSQIPRSSQHADSRGRGRSVLAGSVDGRWCGSCRRAADVWSRPRRPGLWHYVFGTAAYRFQEVGQRAADAAAAMEARRAKQKRAAAQVSFAILLHSRSRNCAAS